MIKSSEDPRPEERKIWIEKFRKVKPLQSTGQPEALAGRIHKSGRKSPVSGGLEPYTGVWSEKQIAHLLRRCLFGVTKNNLSEFKALSIEEAVDRLLQTSPTPPVPVNNYDNTEEGIKDPHVGFGETWTTAPHAGDTEAQRIISLKGWHIHNIINQESTIHEKMIFFWHNLLPTLSWDVYIGKTSYVYSEMLRRNALGNYKTLIRELTTDPCMLIFLNGTRNVKEAPDENYGRELQELFCIGKGPDSKYTEGDVQAAARVLTGWSVDWTKYNNSGAFTSYFNSQTHDTNSKQFSAFYGNRIISGKTGASGADELEELLDMVVEHEETARYICRKLYSFFVFSEIDDQTETEIIRPLALIFKNSNYEIKPVLKVLLESAHFYDISNHGAIIKNPLDHTIGLWRTLGMRSPDPDNALLNYQIYSSLLWHMANMGLEVSDPPNVAGWPAYYQAPQFDKSWITTNTITARALTSDSMIFWGFWISQELQINVDLIAFVKQLDNPDDPVELIRESVLLLLGIEPAENDLKNLKSILLSGQESDIYWGIAWSAYINNPGNDEYKLIVENRLKATFQRLLQAAEYHLM